MLRIVLAQINTTVGDLEGNYQKIIDYILRGRQVSVDVIVFPEIAVTGYPPEDLLLKKYFVADNIKILKKIIVQTTNITAIVGFVDRNKKGELFNAAAVMDNKKLIGVYHKEALPNYGVFDEKRYFLAGENNPIFVLDHMKMGVSICEDIWTPHGPCEAQAKAGVQILINISASPYHFEKWKEREKILRQWVKKHKVFVCYSNLVGGQDELVFDGSSMILNPQGKIVARGLQFEEDLVIADIDVRPARGTKRLRGLQVLSIPKIVHQESRLPIRGKVVPHLQPIEEMFKALVLGTRDYVIKNGFKKVAVGLSGGIDSSLVAVIAKEAIGKENVVGITMPSQFSSSETQSDAKQLAKNLGIRCVEVPIKAIFDSYVQALKNDFAGLPFNITEENLQARIRGDILMAFSNKFGWLVLTTGNKSEIAVGYCTLYGDMSGGFAVIKDVPKTTIYAMAEFVNKKFGNVIPESVLKRAPTAELKENQKDQDTLPPYEVLDPILQAYVEEHRSLFDIAKKTKDMKTIQDVVKMVDRSEYKRRQAPPGVKITPRAFGKDWRLPITNKYKGY